MSNSGPVNSGGCRLDSLATQRIGAGMSVGLLAKLSNTTDALIVRVESGGACAPADADRLAAVLGVTVGDLGFVQL
jgi:hypothetical protein